MNSSWVTLLFVIRHLGKFIYLEFRILRVTTLLHILYFSVYSGFKTLFFLLNTFYEHTTLV